MYRILCIPTVPLNQLPMHAFLQQLKPCAARLVKLLALFMFLVGKIKIIGLSNAKLYRCAASMGL